MAKTEKLALKVGNGCFIPADNRTTEKLRSRGYKVGEIVFANIHRARNPKFNRLAHAIGQLCVENIEDFAHSDSHSVLKRLQIEGDIGCESIAISMRGAWKQFALTLLRMPSCGAIAPALKVIESLLPADELVEMRIPQSMAFESMTEERFHEVVSQFCKYIAINYFKGMTEQQVETMAMAMIGE